MTTPVRYVVIVAEDTAAGLVTDAQKQMLEALPECDFDFEPITDVSSFDDEALIIWMFAEDSDDVLAAKRERDDDAAFCSCGELRHHGPCSE